MVKKLKDKYIGKKVIITSYQAEELGKIGTVISKSENKKSMYFIKFESSYVKILFLEKEFQLLDELSKKDIDMYVEDGELYQYEYNDSYDYNFYNYDEYYGMVQYNKVEKSIFKDLKSKYDKFILNGNANEER